MEDFYEAELRGPHDHPVLATLAGCAVLVAAALLVPRMLPAYPHMILVGAGAAMGFVLWLIGLAVTTRHSRLGWIAGSLAILLGAGALAGTLAHRQYEAGGRADPSTFAEIEFGPEGAPILPKDAASRGPISRLFAESVQADARGRREYMETLGKLGVGNLNSPYLLAQNPQTLANCGKLDEVRAMAGKHSGERGRRRAELGRAIDRAAIDGGLKQAIGEMAFPHGKADPVLANQLASLDATAELCALLARRGWYNANAYFGFNSGADAARYKAIQARRARLASEAEKIDKASVEHMKQGQAKLQALLS
ncbi:hypothetical protein [Sphingomonas sp.]|uniref:hypothetical protein n=1 Tax=Sphingomonas sp. TaxID=28214 RepID=UPI002ED93678